MIFFPHNVTTSGNKKKISMTLHADTELLTLAEAAAFLMVPQSWLYERTRAGTIPVRKLGRHLRFTARALAEWVENQSVRPKLGTAAVV